MDPKYEFDCPRIVNLEEFNNSGVDTWFDDQSKRGTKKKAPGGKLALTVPMSPKFAPIRSKRQNNFKTSEDKDIEETKKQFKATGLNKRILRPRPVNRVVSAAPTQPCSPKFSVENRLKSRKDRKRALEEEESLCSSPPKKRGTKARPAAPAHSGVPVIPKAAKKCTTPIGFPGLEGNVAEARLRRERKVQEALEEERKAREFKAQLLPMTVYTAEEAPSMNRQKPTQPKAFKLQTEQRGAVYQEEFKMAVEEEERRRKEQAVPRATTADVLKKKPFVAKKATKEPTVAKEIQLNSAVRAQVREEYEVVRAQDEEQLRHLHEREEREAKVKEAAQLKALRSDLIMKALPVKHYQPINIEKSKKSLTHPKAPRFRTRSQRQKEKEQAEAEAADLDL